MMATMRLIDVLKNATNSLSRQGYSRCCLPASRTEWVFMHST